MMGAGAIPLRIDQRIIDATLKERTLHRLIKRLSHIMITPGNWFTKLFRGYIKLNIMRGKK